MSGGKGGSQTSETQIPQWVEDPAQRLLQRAEDASQIGYMPYFGMDVAALTPMQQLGMQNQVDAAGAFGLAPQGMDAMAGLPAPQTFANGAQGYSSGPMFTEALGQTAQVAPGFMDAYNQLFTSNSVPGQQGGGLSPYATPDTDLDSFRQPDAVAAPPGFRFDATTNTFVPMGYVPPTSRGFLF